VEEWESFQALFMLFANVLNPGHFTTRAIFIGERSISGKGILCGLNPTRSRGWCSSSHLSAPLEDFWWGEICILPYTGEKLRNCEHDLSFFFPFSRYNLAVVSGALISVGKSIPLDSGKEELIVTIAILAAVVGTLAGGEANNFVGRRPVLIISAILFMFGPLMMACSNSLSILLLGRAVTGIGIGCNAMTTPIYVAEAAPHQLRGALVSCNTLLANLGALAACVCCAIWGGDGVRGGWRVIFGIGALPAIILIIGFLFFLPESPRWLMSEGRVEDAKVVLAQIRGGGDISEELREITMSIEESGQPEKQGRAGFINLFSSAPVRRALALGAIIMLVQQSSGINTLMYYSSSIAEMAGFTDNAAIWSGVGLSFFHTLGVAIGITVVDKFGRRPLMLWSQFLSVLALTALATSFCLSFSHCPKGHWSSFGCICDDVEVTCPPIVYGLLAIVFETIFLFFFGLGMSALPWTVASEIFPLHLRGVGVALCATVNCLGSMVVSSSFLSLAAPTRLNVHGCFALYAFLGLVGWAVLGFLQPETANLT
jgi:sugar porter (SP) family MFS transporter